MKEEKKKRKTYGLQEFAAAHGFSLGKHCCFGSYKGYRVHVKYAAMANPACLITVVTDTKGRDKDLEKWLEKNKRELKLTAYGVVGIGLMVSPQLYANIFRQIEEILGKIVAHLARAGFPGENVCPYCGTPLEGNGVEILESDIPFACHDACFERALNVAKQREEQARTAPAHRGAGIGGAALGAFVGIAVFVLMFLWWGFAALGAAVGVLLGSWLYGRFGGKNEPFKIAFIAVANIVLLLAAYALCLYFDAGGVREVFDGIRADAAYRQSFLLNTIFLFVFDLIGTAYGVFALLRDRKKVSANMRRREERGTPSAGGNK